MPSGLGARLRSGASGAAFVAFFGVRLFGYILSSIFSLPAYIGPWFPYAISGVLIALVLSFSLTLLLVGRGTERSAADGGGG